MGQGLKSRTKESTRRSILQVNLKREECKQKRKYEKP
jgi:hypothetical protein